MTRQNFSAAALAALSLLCASGMSFGANGRIDAPQNIAKIVPGSTTDQQVRDLLGMPLRTMTFPARGLKVMEYDMYDYSDHILVEISIARGGIVRDVTRLVQSGS